MPPITVALLDLFHPAIDEAVRAALPTGWTPRFATAKSADAQALALADADIALPMAAPMPAALLDAAPRLRFIQKLGAGVDRIDLETCRRRGIGVARLNAGNAIPVAEHTVMMMLATYRRLPLNDRRTRAGHWDKEEGRGVNRHMHGKRVALLGFGAIGQAVARLLGGFGVEVVFYDPMPPPAEVSAALGARAVTLDEAIATADIVSLHLPLMAETAGLIGRERIGAMKRGAVLINCARGGLVDEAALAEALADGHLFAAGIDCFSQEPPGDSPLLRLDSTVVTSHLAGATLDNFSGVMARAVANAEAFLAGRALPERDVVLVPR